MGRLKQSYSVVIALITIGIVIGVVLVTGFNLDNHSIAGETPTIYTEPDPDDDSAGQTLTAGNFNPNLMFTEIVENVRPSIVSIYTTKNVKVPAHPFFDFFRDERFDRDSEEREFQQQGLGSGIIISEDGYILTNNHVVSDMDELRVQMVDNLEYEAEIVGTDPTTDIALIKIEAEDLPFAILGNSDHVKIGEWVMAIGSPLRLTSTVTAGIVSALSRDINIIQNENPSYGIENFIQTDAAINPGNSGGALVNLQGQVIGVNTAIASRTNYYMGYGFAVPINIAKSVVDDLLKFGEVKRGYLGVYIEAMDPIKAKGVKLDKPRGVFITSVIENRAGDKAGIREGDVILTVNGQEVNQPNQLQARIGKYNPGDEVELEVWRDGEMIRLTAVLEGREGEAEPISADTKEKKRQSIPDLGIKVQDINTQQLNRLDLDYGVLVSSVKQFTPAAKAGIVQNDVIYELDREPVKSVDAFYDRISEQEPGDVIRLKIRRKIEGDNFDRLVFMEIPENE